MSQKCWVSKGDMLVMLGNDAFNFCGFLAKVDPSMTDEQKASADVINKMFEITPSSGVELDEALVQGMLTQLITAGVISQATKDSIDSWIAEKLTPELIPDPEPPPAEPEPELPYKTYIVNVEGNINEWLNANAAPSGGGYIVMDNQVTLRGTLPSPAEEVI